MALRSPGLAAMPAGNRPAPLLGAWAAPLAERLQLRRAAVDAFAKCRPAVDALGRLGRPLVVLEHLAAAGFTLVDVRPVVVAPRKKPRAHFSSDLKRPLGTLLLEPAGLEGAVSGAELEGAASAVFGGVLFVAVQASELLGSPLVTVNRGRCASRIYYLNARL